MSGLGPSAGGAGGGELHVGCNFKTMATDTLLCQ